jgi:eukaryotic-like serine/threonine-protein kinase
MALAAGRRLGSYEVLAPLGAGGMGEVYRARDTRLGRDVAIKVLASDRLADEARRAQFVREARAASALSHPHIVVIHEIETLDGIDFIVMELVSGKTLAERIRPGMRLAETLRIAIAVADALARAHAAGIVHRDLKPANVMVGDDGTVKILDFGLAKLVADEAGEADDDVATATADALSSKRSGAIAGTPGYMSPEQATGAPVDSRSDVFSFGIVLYEMATGRRAFPGSSTADTLAKVVSADPAPPRKVARGVPEELEKLILRCLRKEPGRRLQHMDDVKLLLEEIRDDVATRSAAPAPAVRPSARWLLAALAALIVLVGGVLEWRRRSGPPPMRLLPVTTMAGTESTPCFSPDGTQVAFSWEGEARPAGALADRDIWIKLVAGTEMRRLTSGPGDDWNPSWSPDGSQVAFLRIAKEDATSGKANEGGAVHVISALGGQERRLGFAARFSQLAWSPDGQWIAGGPMGRDGETDPGASGIHVIPVAGGDSRALTTPPQPGWDMHPAFSPDGRRLAYVSCAGTITPPCDVFVVGLDGAVRGSSSPRRLSDRSGAIHGVAWTRDGRYVIYARSFMYFNGRGMGSHLWRVAADGGAPERIELAPPGSFAPATTPARDRLLFGLDRSDIDIYGYEPGGTVRPVMASSWVDYGPRFSPDGRRIVFESFRSGDTKNIWVADADGSNPVQLTRPPNQDGAPGWSPDGLRIVFNRSEPNQSTDIWTMDADGGSQRPLTEGGPYEAVPVWSRDGRWIYYREDRKDGQDIVRISADAGGGERITKTGRFIMVEESPDGRALFYTTREGKGPLYGLDLDTRIQRQIEECVFSRALASTARGLYYVGCTDGREAPIYRLETSTGQRQLLGKIDREGAVMGLAVSADERTILYGREVPWNSDLTMIEGFR